MQAWLGGRIQGGMHDRQQAVNLLLSAILLQHRVMPDQRSATMLPQRVAGHINSAGLHGLVPVAGSEAAELEGHRPFAVCTQSRRCQPPGETARTGVVAATDLRLTQPVCCSRVAASGGVTCTLRAVKRVAHTCKCDVCADPRIDGLHALGFNANALRCRRVTRSAMFSCFVYVFWMAALSASRARCVCTNAEKRGGPHLLVLLAAARVAAQPELPPFILGPHRVLKSQARPVIFMGYLVHLRIRVHTAHACAVLKAVPRIHAALNAAVCGVGHRRNGRECAAVPCMPLMRAAAADVRVTAAQVEVAAAAAAAEALARLGLRRVSHSIPAPQWQWCLPHNV